MNEVIYKPDFYTKAVLTIIAVCLLFICFNLMLSPKEAVAKKDSVLDVNIKEIGGSYFGNKLPVNIEAVNGSNINNSIKVDIDAINSTRLYGYELPVKIKN